MSLLSLLAALNYGLVLIYGLLLATYISGGWENKRQKKFILALCPALLLVQFLLYQFLGENAVWRLYPLIAHLPLVLALILLLKKPVGLSVVSVCTAYLCCQLPRWVQLMVSALNKAPLVGEIFYTLSIVPIFMLLRRYFTRPAHSAMTGSRHSLLLFGSLPVAYYLFDYLTAVYSDILHTNARMLNEFLPTALILFYVLFLTAYHVEEQAYMEAKLQSSMLESELSQSRSEIDILRQAQTQTAIYRHDMRHHLSMLENMLCANKTKQAEEYIKKVQADVESTMLRRYCENELMNLLCSSFADKAQRMGVELKINARLSKELPIPDIELCTVVSNALENALNAAREACVSPKEVEFYSGIKHNKLLIEIKNPYSGDIALEDGLPVSHREGHGYGCRSILAIAQRHRGLCTFEPSNGVFTMRVFFPIHE